MSDAADEVIDEVETPEADAEVVETEDVTEDVEASEDEPSESSTEKKEGEGKEGDGFQKRIDELTAIRREEERQRIAAEQRARELEQQLEQMRPKQQPGMKLADFDYDEDKYAEYLNNQAAERARAEAQHRIQQEKAQQKQAEFSVRETDFAKEHTDYHAVTRNPNLRLTQEMVDVAQGSEHGPDLLYHLAQNPDVSDRISYLNPLDMAREMGRLEATITQPKPKPVSKAPEPPKTLKATEKVTTISASSAESDKLSTEEWLKRREKELAKRQA